MSEAEGQRISDKTNTRPYHSVSSSSHHLRGTIVGGNWHHQKDHELTL